MGGPGDYGLCSHSRADGSDLWLRWVSAALLTNNWGRNYASQSGGRKVQGFCRNFQPVVIYGLFHSLGVGGNQRENKST